MNRKLINYAIVLIIVAVAAIFYFSNSKGTFRLKSTNFAVEDVNSVTKIKIENSNKSLILEKEGDDWIVNSKYKVKNWSIENFLTTLNRIEILQPVSKSEKDQVNSIIEHDGFIVEIFKGKRLIKHYLVSLPSMSKSKTYMRMYKSSNPFIVHIPSFKGHVAELFVADENYWRDNTVFDYEPQNIKEISVKYPANMEKSFCLTNYQDGTFSVKSIEQDQFLDDFNMENLINYFTYFQSITFEKVLIDLDKTTVDSIIGSEPYFTITVTDIQNQKKSISVYRKPPEQQFDEFGNEAKFDYNRAYAVLNQNREIILVQYYIFDSLLKEIDYFR